jgi:ribosomal protein L21
MDKKHINKGDIIEGNSVKLEARKISPGMPEKLCNKRIYTFKLQDHAFAEVLKSPEKRIISSSSFINAGDNITGDLIEGGSEKKIPTSKQIKKKNIKNKTGRHKAQVVNTNKFTYAKISREWKDRQISINNRREE